MNRQVSQIRKDHEANLPFSVLILELGASDVAEWVRFRVDPQRFRPDIFEGDWAVTTDHPTPGDIRVVRVITGSDGISRAIGRQGSKIYASPWLL
jgi:hypothetical protein